MAEVPKIFPRYSIVGESVLLLELASQVNQQVNDVVYLLDAQMQNKPLQGVVEWVPGYASILVQYDPLVTSHFAVRQWLQDCDANKSNKLDVHPKKIQIRVRYGGEAGPDLENVADLHGISTSTVVRKHTAKIYKVGMMGFTPGFAYLIGLDPDLETPRLATPRTKVTKGSVGIAGSQTGIYPLDSPGGWQIIGRTEQNLFNPEGEPHFLLSPGDEVQFVALRDGFH
jgi:KipI family sensor histidine kinase inhibitor